MPCNTKKENLLKFKNEYLSKFNKNNKNYNKVEKSSKLTKKAGFEILISNAGVYLDTQ